MSKETVPSKMIMPSGAYVWYIIINILTFGMFYFTKITIMKAIIDANNSIEK